MNIVFLGDSVTEGAGASVIENCYVNLVKKMLNCSVCNGGLGGTRIARRKTWYDRHVYELNFRLRLQVLPDTADYVFVFGGLNDQGHGDASIGDFDRRDEFTFNGALRLLIEDLSKKYGKEKIRFILPFKWFGYNKKAPFVKEEVYEKDFVDALVKMLNEYNIPYLDLFNNFVDAPTTESPCEYFVDGIHPSDKGHQLIAEKVCEFIKQNP